jgi:hypothetical protein
MHIHFKDNRMLRTCKVCAEDFESKRYKVYCFDACRRLEHNRKNRLNYRKNHEQEKQRSNTQSREYYYKNTLRALISKAKSRTTVPFDITEDDFANTGFCPVFGTSYQIGTPYAMSIDRIDSQLGYTKGNVQLMSRRANTMKNNATKEELKAFARWINRMHND